MIEDTKLHQEISKTKKAQKEIIKENIKNVYNNKIQMLREKMTERKLYKRIFDIEHKAAFSDAERSRKAERKIIHENNKNLLKKQIEVIELGVESEVEEVFKKILKLYKKTAPVMSHKI